MQTQKQFTQNKGSKAIKRLEAEIWFESQTTLSYKEFKQWTNKLTKS